MSALVIYVSMFGNTRALAEAVADGIRTSLPVSVHEVADAPDDVSGYDLVVISGPTHAFSMSRDSTRADAVTKTPDGVIISTGRGIREWLDAVVVPTPPIPVAVFDTKARKPRLPGSAAKAAAKVLRAKGWPVSVKPMTFTVEGMLGPVTDGETERARAWGESIARLASHTTSG